MAGLLEFDIQITISYQFFNIGELIIRVIVFLTNIFIFMMDLYKNIRIKQIGLNDLTL